jgi:hypothetical protein
VGPKRDKLEDANIELKQAEAAFALKQEQLWQAEETVQALQQEFQVALEKRGALEAKARECRQKMDRATRLLSSMEDEKVQWTQYGYEQTEALKYGLGATLLSAAFIAYLGVLDRKGREFMLSKWTDLLDAHRIQVRACFSLLETLGDTNAMRMDQNAQLPNDQISRENTIVLRRSTKWPLMIDPQKQAKTWLQNLHPKMHCIRQVEFFVYSELETRLNTKNRRVLENAIQFGEVVLIEDIPDKIDSFFVPLLAVKRGGVKNQTVQVGDTNLRCDEMFQLYFTTRCTTFPPETCVGLNILNFAITADGLKDQLLSAVVAFEEPAIQLESYNLQVEAVTNSKRLNDIETSILEGLENAQGSILDDELLLNTLSESKETSNRISRRQREAKATEKMIEEKRDAYSKIADIASSLFFDVSSLPALSFMYNFSLEWYIGMFSRVLQDTPKGQAHSGLSGLNDWTTIKLKLIDNVNDDCKRRQQGLCVYLLKALWVEISRALTPEHLLVVAFSFAMKFLIVKNVIRQHDLNALLDIQCEGLADTFEDSEVFTVETNRKIRSISQRYSTVNFLQQLSSTCRGSRKYAMNFKESVLDSNTPLDGIRKLAVGEDTSALQFIGLVLVKELRPDMFVKSVESAVEGVR